MKHALILAAAVIVPVMVVFDNQGNGSGHVHVITPAQSADAVSVPAPDRPPVSAVPPPAPVQAQTQLSGRVELQRAPNGHFYADVLINGVPIHALVDTGASAIALSRADADKLGLITNTAAFTGTAMTANGESHFAPVMLNTVALGALSTSNVPAGVVEGDIPQSLLGMTFLSKFKVSIDGDTMVLS